MNTMRLAQPQPAATLHDVEREREAIARDVVRHWPRAVGKVLRLAARAGAHNRRAVALGMAPIAFDPPLSAADALWAELGRHDAGLNTIRQCGPANARQVLPP